MRFWCCFGRNSISSGMYRRMSSRMAAARHSSASQNLRISSLGSLLLMCSGTLSKMSKQTSARARFRTTDHSSLASVCSCPATPRYRTLWHEEKFPFSFSDTVVFLWNHAPNTWSVRNPRQESPSFYPTLLQTTSLVSALSCLAFFFESDHFLAPSWKTLWTAMPMAAMELKHRVCFPTKTIHWISCNSSFPTLATHLMMDMHTPPLASCSVQLTVFPAYALWP